MSLPAQIVRAKGDVGGFGGKKEVRKKVNARGGGKGKTGTEPRVVGKNISSAGL